MRTEKSVLIEDHLGESLSTGSSTEFSSETERFVDGKVSLDSVHRSSRSLLLREDHTTLLVEGRVDTSEGVLGALNFDLVDGLLESGLGEKRSGVDDTSAGRDELSSSSVNGISVESDIEDVVSVASHDLLSARSLCRKRKRKTSQIEFREEKERRRRNAPLVAHWKAATQESLISLRN